MWQGERERRRRRRVRKGDIYVKTVIVTLRERVCLSGVIESVLNISTQFNSNNGNVFSKFVACSSLKIILNKNWIILNMIKHASKKCQKF